MRIFFGFLVLLFFGTANAGETSYALTLVVPSARSAPLFVSVYDGDASFLDADAATILRRFPKSEDNTYVITPLPQGEYALAIFQDLNGNATLDKSFWGIPREPYGFSNNPEATMGPPSFDKCRFDISKDKTLKIDLK